MQPGYRAMNKKKIYVKANSMSKRDQEILHSMRAKQKENKTSSRMEVAGG